MFWTSQAAALIFVLRRGYEPGRLVAELALSVASAVRSRGGRIAGAWLLAFGATVGTLLDAMHTFGGVTEYLHPFVLRTAWWVPLLFMSAYGFGGYLYALGYARLGGKTPEPSWTKAVVAVACFAALYAISAFLPASNAIKLVLLILGAVALFLSVDRSWQGVALAVGLPMWLPALYLAAGPSFGQFARRVVQQT